MILSALREGLARSARAWAKTAGLPPPESFPLAAPPAHVRAHLSLPWAMALGKVARKNPLELAKALARAFEGLAEIEKAEAVPPGFVNLTLRPEALAANLKALIAAPAAYGRDGNLAQRRILLEYVSANPTGPLHMASGRGATLGDCLVRILRRIGHEVQTEYYVNDAGGRLEMLGKSLHARRHGAEPPEGGYHGQYIADLAKSFPPEADSWTPEQFQRPGVEAFLAGHKADIEAFGASFDLWLFESELHAQGALEAAMKRLKERGMVYEKDGAVWLGTAAAEGSEDDKDRVLIKAGGQPTYFLADIAYHENKYARGFSEVIDIFGADHHGYVPRLRAAMAALGHPPESFHAIVHQLIHLYRGKEQVKMSKRAGEFVRLREVVDEVGKDACRFFFAMRTPEAHLNFDLELAKKQSSENPVYYCQYVHARICSIFREAKKQGLIQSADEVTESKGALLAASEEAALLMKLAWFPEVLKTCEEVLSPHPLANYILELAGLFHPFYEKCRVADAAAPELSKDRLLLCAGARDVIAQGLGLLGVSAPEQM
ncbi:MAG: arginine--tRNA ligase [Elusimicrobia bacterium]|nr:arginine--tRNA ligase [Elusimicrobiota bacterium]